MSEKQEENVVNMSKSQVRRISVEMGKELPVTDEDFEIFMKAFLSDYKGPGYNPE